MPSQIPDGFAVFMSNIPSHLSSKSLKRELSPSLDKLGIEDWDCDKPNGKSFGTLAFLHRKDGQAFLNRHSQQPIPGALFYGKPRMKARLHLLQQPIFCKESDRGVDSTWLKVLELNADERSRAAEDLEKPQKQNAVVFAAWSLSCGHYDYPNGELTYTADIQWPSTKGTAKFAKNALVARLPYSPNEIRLEIPYRTIHQVVISDRPSSLFLTLFEPPRIFLLGQQSTENDWVSTFGNLSTGAATRPAERERVCKIPHSNADHSEVLGQSLVYRIILSPEEFASKIERLRRNEYLDFATENIPVASFGGSYMAEGLASFKSTVTECSPTIPFDTLYQFQGLVQNGYLLPHTAQSLLLRLRKSRYHGPSKKVDNTGRTQSKQPLLPPLFSAQAVKKLFSQILFPGPYTKANAFDPDVLWSQLEGNENEIQKGLTRELFSERARQNLTMVYKVQVTPTRILFNGPEPEAKNRILRKFSRHTDYFARIQFCDEDGQDLYFNPKVSLTEVYSRFRKILIDGFPIAGRLYKFLGFSHSSLRSHAVWFMAGFVDENKQLRSYATVIPELGDFKGAARIGQAFSETPIAVDLEELGTRIEFIPDVKSADGSRMFSDGVGTMSKDLLTAIHDTMPKSSTATCAQIRWAGAKGMLSLDDTLEGSVMRVRDSMTKFQSNDIQNLEICDIANKPIPLVLNRQMIKILEDMQVPEEWFFKAQNRELNRLRKITAKTNNTVIFLRRQKIADQMAFYRFIRRLHDLGLDYKKDSFLCSVVEAVVLREVRLLKHKSRIPVEQGVTLFGVMDEFGYLGEEEVFVTFDKSEGTPYPDLHNRFVIVTRSPALHPGDIQICKAIVPPHWHPLSSLSNCIVFSQKGSRDLPSQLSGGDLDGDIYNIIWDTIAVDGCQLEFGPADYPRVSPLDIGRDVEAKDMTNFFVNFMATDQLGLIATRHIILADIHPAGTVHDECKLLAEMHSTAVDYSKTGIPVDMTKMASVKRTRYRPEFMAPAPPANIVDKTEIQFETPIAPSIEEDEDDDTGPQHKFYKSDKILGKLYRAINEKKIWKDDIHLVVNRFGPTLWDGLFVHINDQCEKHLGLIKWEKALDHAHSIRQAYDDTISRTTIDFSEHSSKGITELEVFTGMIFNKSGIQTRRQRDASTRLKDEFNRITKWIEGLIRNHSAKLSGDTSDGLEDPLDYKDNEESTDIKMKYTALELSIACLHAGVVHTGSHIPGQRNADHFESFKVIAAHCALRELENAIRQREIADGAVFTSGGFPGIKSGKA
ncbi:putative RNA-dependent RNA polymerase [Rosellinia necatrix]|uniref:RNA-dependent RNA polymerase n=1 Tax=Rosellinia necatrix TaxID=77044 RepID=A0A1S8A9V2_ROSNE|nr:putative RNA-dependent RNA polymerase [Rosellinia necatrix]